MDWVLLVIIAGAPAPGTTANSTTIPMATVERCNAAKDKLVAAIKVYQSPHYAVVAECLQTR